MTGISWSVEVCGSILHVTETRSDGFSRIVFSSEDPEAVTQWCEDNTRRGTAIPWREYVPDFGGDDSQSYWHDHGNNL
jgi:hypothetical protein